MNQAKLVLLGLLAAGLTVAGCTTHITRNDTDPSPGAAAPAADVAQAGATPSADQAAPSTPAAAPAAEGGLPAPMANAGAAPAATDAAAAPAGEVAAAAPAKAAAAAPAADQKTSEAATPQETKQAVALLPLPAAEVTDTIKKLTQNPRVRYLSRTAQYDYYVGGRLDAKYDINNNQLIVTGANEADPVKCEYGQDGAMIAGGKVPPKTIGECNALINELGGYLSH